MELQRYVSLMSLFGAPSDPLFGALSDPLFGALSDPLFGAPSEPPTYAANSQADFIKKPDAP